ncbi:MAG: response regulator [Gemmatimonadetes bacterium]|nr:response regulator [Gemmatimonadota bacterium]
MAPVSSVASDTDGLWYFEFDPPVPTDLDLEAQVAWILQHGRLTGCSDGLARMYGYHRAAEFAGTSIRDMLVDADQNADMIRDFVRSGYRLDGVESVERHAQGDVRRFLNHGTGIVRDGHLVASFGTQTDVAARLALEAQIRQADTVAALNRLAGGVAHDFNNLLTTILTSVDMLEEQLEPAHAAMQDSAEIRRAARRGAELTRQLLALSQQQVLVPRPIDLNLVVRRALAAFRRTVREEIDVREITLPEAAIATVDGDELEQVLVGLVNYAAESIPARGVIELAVELVHVPEPRAGTPDTLGAGTWVAITMTDSGPPFAVGVGTHLFEPFFGIALAESASGMALATLRGFARQSGGAVQLHPPATGRRLSAYFPASASAGVVETRGDRTSPSSGTVLLAEDEPTVRLLMKRVLQRAGFVVLVASDGDEALDLSRGYAGPIDLLVTDVIMPGMGGGELSRRLRQERPGLRVLHVSGYTAGALRQNEALEDGAAFLQKPFTPRALVSRVVEVMGERVGE